VKKLFLERKYLACLSVNSVTILGKKKLVDAAEITIEKSYSDAVIVFIQIELGDEEISIKSMDVKLLNHMK
jgi:hypothetical protein